MQPSDRSATPRQRGRRDSATSIQIDQEVSVFSSQRDDLKEISQRAINSTIPSLSNGQTRPPSQGPPATVTAPPLNRWNSDSRMSVHSRASSRSRPRAQHSLHSQTSIDVELFETNRESMKALSEFLRTKEPPPDNFMSVPDSYTMSLRSIKKKSAFKIFGRAKSKRSKTAKLMQLPDSAVSAKTLGGARHIAISIPIEFDDLVDTPRSQVIPEKRPHSLPNKLPSEMLGAVSVLRPVEELGEPGSFPPTQNKHSRVDGRQSNGSATTPASKLLGPETARALEHYYTQLSREQKQRAESLAGVKSEKSSRPQSSCVAVSPFAVNPHENRRIDARHSGGTIYSTASIATQQGHTRGVSSVSTAPSINPSKLEIQPRISSIYKVPRSLQAELAQNFATLNPRERGPITATPSPQAESLGSGTSKSHSPQAVSRAAEDTQGYHTVGGEIPRGHTPQATSPAHIRLPDLPESALVPCFIPQPSPPPSEGKKTPPAASKSPLASVKTIEDPTQAARQSRRDRVKARKARDMAALRERSANPQVLPDISPQSSQRTRPSTALQPTKQQSISQERSQRRRENTLSEIMLVADLPPVAEVIHLSDLGKNVEAKASSNFDANLSARGTHTPPRSFTSSHFSDSDTIPREEDTNRSLGPSSPRSVRSGLDSRRQEQRSKRNISLRERELDSRLQKIERDNAMLLSTLSGIAKSFGDLSEILPKSKQRKEGRMFLGDVDCAESMEAPVMPIRKMRSLEPVMRELQSAAGQVSFEAMEEYSS